MPIDASEILLRLSGGAGNSSPAASLGGVMSTTTVIADNTANNLFDKITGSESTAGRTDYRGFYVLNNDGALTLEDAGLYVDSETTHTGVDVEFGLALEGLNVTMDTIALETDAPDPAVTFSDATGVGARLVLGNIPFGQRYGIWAKRVINAGTAAKTDYTVVIKVVGDTPE
jgi:hypothetical protein